MRGDKAPPESQNPGTFDAHLAITHTPFGSLHLCQDAGSIPENSHSGRQTFASGSSESWQKNSVRVAKGPPYPMRSIQGTPLESFRAFSCA